ncbi:ribosomal subunit 39S-domain-containing protein [Biscogniauxia mediterranea]|nr:ribosomal subunit 39S-domain-containing protein [Biscogniauxia mediterranea]
MRRIPRLRIPPSLSSSSFSSNPQTTTARATAAVSLPRPAPSPSKSSKPPHLARFYSSDKQVIPQSLAPTPEEQHHLAAEHTEPHQYHLYKPPPPRSYASRSDEVSDPSYTPATTAAGLETVGDLANWWDQSQNWSEASDFVGFRPREKVVHPLSIEAAVRRAVVEAFALRQAGKDDHLTQTWPIGGMKEFRCALELDVKSTEKGHVSLEGPVAEVVRSLQWETAGPEAGGNDSSPIELPVSSIAQTTPQLPSTELSKLRKSWDGSWKRASLADPRIKFAVTKRVFQLTGQLTPDHALPDITSVTSLLQVVQKAPKPKTLTEEIQKRGQDLIHLPNVTVATKRVTRGDKEQALGRLKLMQEELRKRDLPLEGHGFARKNRELAQLRGGM